MLPRLREQGISALHETAIQRTALRGGRGDGHAHMCSFNLFSLSWEEEPINTVLHRLLTEYRASICSGGQSSEDGAGPGDLLQIQPLCLSRATVSSAVANRHLRSLGSAGTNSRAFPSGAFCRGKVVDRWHTGEWKTPRRSGSFGISGDWTHLVLWLLWRGRFSCGVFGVASCCWLHARHMRAGEDILAETARGGVKSPTFARGGSTLRPLGVQVVDRIAFVDV